MIRIRLFSIFENNGTREMRDGKRSSRKSNMDLSRDGKTKKSIGE